MSKKLTLVKDYLVVKKKWQNIKYSFDLNTKRKANNKI